MIRNYGNSILNLTKVVKLDLRKKSLVFTLQTNEDIGGNFMFFAGGSNKETLTFETEEEASTEFNNINNIMSQYYKK